VSYSDPYGLKPDTVQIGWRPVTGGIGALGAMHFAIRVGGNGHWLGGELLDRHGKNAVVTFNAAGNRASQYQWTTIPAPAGQTQRQADANALRSFATQAAAFDGKPYGFGGDHNSNKLIFLTVTGFGGSIPGSVVPAGHFAPGICGGGPKPLDPGSQCSPNE
jgi:hypothetical protein